MQLTQQSHVLSVQAFAFFHCITSFNEGYYKQNSVNTHTHITLNVERINNTKSKCDLF